MGMTASAQTSITFDTNDYAKIGVYDQWEESPFRLGILKGNAGVADNPDKGIDKVLGIAPNATNKVVALQRSRHGGNAFGVRIDLKEPIRVTKQLQYIHVMAYLKDKPADSRVMVMGLGKRLENSWNWQTGEDEQFWALTNAPVKAKEGWQDIVVSFKGFSYSKEENANSGIDIYSLIIVPDLRSPHADTSDWVAYFDEIVVDNNPEKRFNTIEINKEVTLDVQHGDNVSVSASQLNGDIVLAKDLSPLQKHKYPYGQPLKVKVIPENGFVQYGFQLKYGRNVNAPEQWDENGNPNWILVKVPYTAISAVDGTYTIPAEYMRGAQVSIVGDMQQVQHYTVQVAGAPKGQGGADFLGKVYGDKAVIDASQYFTADEVKAVSIEGYESQVSLDNKTNILTVTYKK